MGHMTATRTGIGWLTGSVHILLVVAGFIFLVIGIVAWVLYVPLDDVPLDFPLQ
jgi:hypothetical protein